MSSPALSMFLGELLLPHHPVTLVQDNPKTHGSECHASSSLCHHHPIIESEQLPCLSSPQFPPKRGIQRSNTGINFDTQWQMEIQMTPFNDRREGQDNNKSISRWDSSSPSESPISVIDNHYCMSTPRYIKDEPSVSRWDAASPSHLLSCKQQQKKGDDLIVYHQHDHPLTGSTSAATTTVVADNALNIPMRLASPRRKSINSKKKKYSILTAQVAAYMLDTTSTTSPTTTTTSPRRRVVGSIRPMKSPLSYTYHVPHHLNLPKCPTVFCGDFH